MTDSQCGKRVLAAMSGGVDSSVAAYALVQAGFDVEGVTMKLFENADACLADTRVCCSMQDAEDARQVCLALGIPHFVYNFTRTFNREVIDRFCDGYRAGETPNPCIDCNRHVKFEALQERRRALGYDYVATGHYARRVFDEDTGRYLLMRAKDAAKDQSYVLFHLTQETLAHMLFPLGDLEKPAVRALASAQGFGNADKPESQDICFVPDGDYAAFIERRRGPDAGPGPIVDRSGALLGRHAGLVGYTAGQRKGIGVAGPEPYYVYAKDAARNRLIVDTDERARCAGVAVRELNLVSLPEIGQPGRYLVKTHYRQRPVAAQVLQTAPDAARITFDAPQRACAPGQAAVIYDGDVVVGGGTIDAIF